MPKSKTPRSMPNYLQSAMEAQRLSQAQLAKMSGVAQAYIGRMLRGGSAPTTEALERVAGAMGVDPSRLLGKPQAPIDPQLARLNAAYEKCTKRNKRLVVQLAEGLARDLKK